mmetsp:Transcript_5911/g.11174  ORF Transcript_5911/g.11174 Transcript_5911/m.11174 type:complete len:102 (-) Transcript_5911:435-740(-)
MLIKNNNIMNVSKIGEMIPDVSKYSHRMVAKGYFSVQHNDTDYIHSMSRCTSCHLNLYPQNPRKNHDQETTLEQVTSKDTNTLLNSVLLPSWPYSIFQPMD